MFRDYIISKLLRKGEKITTTQEELNLKTEIASLRAKLAVKPLSRGELTMMQLGSYVPNFEGLATKSDEFKKAVGRVCFDLMRSESWKFLITQLKQDQVNLYFFNEDEKKSEEFVRGSINGIYIVDEQINSLATSYAQYIDKNTTLEK